MNCLASILLVRSMAGQRPKLVPRAASRTPAYFTHVTRSTMLEWCTRSAFSTNLRTVSRMSFKNDGAFGKSRFWLPVRQKGRPTVSGCMRRVTVNALDTSSLPLLCSYCKLSGKVEVLTEERDVARSHEEHLFAKLTDQTEDLEALQESYVSLTDR